MRLRGDAAKRRFPREWVSDLRAARAPESQASRVCSHTPVCGPRLEAYENQEAGGHRPVGDRSEARPRLLFETLTVESRLESHPPVQIAEFVPNQQSRRL
jgi:hypothetical protein